VIFEIVGVLAGLELTVFQGVQHGINPNPTNTQYGFELVSLVLCTTWRNV
jgi:hypothetical protein